MSAKAGNRSNDKAMQSTALPVAGQRMAESSDSLTSAPRGILFNPIPNILRQKKFDGTRGGQRIDIWLEEADKSLVINPDIFRLWKGQSSTGMRLRLLVHRTWIDWPPSAGPVLKRGHG